MRSSVVALLSIFLLFYMGSWNLRERVLVVVAPLLVAWVFTRIRSTTLGVPRKHHLLLAGLALLVYDTLFPRIIPHGEVIYSSATHTLLVNSAWVLTGAFIWKERSSSTHPTVIASILGVAFITGGLLILNTPDPPIDVWQLHAEGGRALVSGGNPYADLEIAASFDADADSAVITGYAYSPPNLFGFGLASVLTGDSRWFSLGCWLVFLLCLWQVNPSERNTALVWLVASQPALPLVLQIGYTETLTIMLAGLTVLWWKRWPAGAALCLGLALASKQYLVVLAPMVLAARLIPWRQRVLTGLTAGATALLGVVWGLGHYWDAVVSFHQRVPPQTGSMNLYGLTSALGEPVAVSTMLGGAVAAGVGVWIATTGRSSREMVVGSALTLTVGFFLASQAFVNYWLLVACLVCLAVALPSVQVGDRESGRPLVADRAPL